MLKGVIYPRRGVVQCLLKGVVYLRRGVVQC